MNTQVSAVDFFRCIDRDNFSLTIYYLSPYILTPYPLSAEDLKNGRYDYHVIVDDQKLREHIDILIQISNMELVPVEQESYIEARIYYIFEKESSNELFSVAMGGKNSVFVNGKEVKEDKIFYDVIMPFLPEDAIKELQSIQRSR